MSRTDKDLPNWVAEYYNPQHGCAEFGMSYWSKHRAKACDLPELTYKNISEGGYWANRRISVCHWAPIEPPGKKKWYDCNPGWWYHEVWLEPERARVRDECHRAKQEYNASRDTDVDVADYRKKHNGGWFW